MNQLILGCKKRSNKSCELTIESFIILTLWKLLKGEEKIDIQIYEEYEAINTTTISVNCNELGKNIEFVPVIAVNEKIKLPMLKIDNDNFKIIGLCSILRAICRIIQTSKEEDKLATQLLGYKENCLMATSEVSLWVNFCEREMISCAEKLFQKKNVQEKIEFPIEILKLELEFNNPVRSHNVFQIVRKTKNNKSLQSHCALNIDLEHKYCHGNEANLSDCILYVIFKLIFMTVEDNVFENNIPLVMSWFHNIENEMKYLKEIITNLLITNIKMKVQFKKELPIVEPNGKYFSLFKRQLRGQKAKIKAQKKIVDQKEIDMILSKLKSIDIKSEPGNVHEQSSLSDSFIEELLTRGELPPDRFERKKFQLKSLTVEVLKIAKDKDVIVDFCSGTGHLGLLIAKLLPNCNIIILENKEESIKRAKQKAKSLGLSNVSFYQCNLEYFYEQFTIGVGLHACGIATDLWMNKCYKTGASFVCSPCCYGKIQDLGNLNLPQSKIFKQILSTHEFISISHCSDQSHDEKNVKHINLEKAQQGFWCMDIIDTDRSLRAKELGYKVRLTRLVPEDCTPKNRLLIGLSPNYKILY